MNSWMSRATVLVFLTAAACSQPPGEQPETQVPASAAAAEPAPKSEAIARADALLEDFRRREAAQAKYDRENPPPRFVPIPKTLVDAAKAAAASTASVTPASNASAGPPGAPAGPTAAAPARNEMWWKRQMESLQTALDQELVTLAAMEKMNMKYGYNDAQALYKKQAAAVANARQAIDRLRDEARRAGVPPGWLRP